VGDPPWVTLERTLRRNRVRPGLASGESAPSRRIPQTTHGSSPKLLLRVASSYVLDMAADWTGTETSIASSNLVRVPLLL